MNNTISTWILYATDLLKKKREAELLLLYHLKKPLTYIYLHNNQKISKKDLELLDILLQRRIKGEPFAYITGKKEFWSLEFNVTPDVLIPRPETELLIEITLELIKKPNASILDLGTGSGAIAISIAHQMPNWSVTATDASARALKIANLNAITLLKENSIEFHQANWLNLPFNKNFDVIISNPPYIREQDSHLINLIHEPITALTSGLDGLDDIRSIIQDSPNYLKANGWLLLEHGYDQQEAVTELLIKRGFNHTQTWKDYSGISRVTGASLYNNI